MAADPQVLDRAWRLWASVIIVGILILGGLIGFVVLPMAWAPEPPAVAESPQPAPGKAQPASHIVWSGALLTRLSRAGAQTAPASVQVCAGCHGAQGISSSPTFPNLAGQSAAAIYKALQDYRDGSRSSPIMSPMAKMLTDDQVIDVAAYFSRLPRGDLDAQKAASPNPLVVKLVESGDPQRALPPCAGCHGVKAGGPVETPTLAGQHEEYLLTQLHLFARRERRDDLFERMRSVAAVLTEQEMQQLAAYYANSR